MNRYKPAILLLTTLFIGSCSRNHPKINLSSINEEVKIIRFEKEMFSLGKNPDSLQIETFYRTYPEFAGLFFDQVVSMGNPSDSAGRMLIHGFLNDSVILEMKKRIENLFPENAEFQDGIISAFRHYSFYFPGKPLPEMYTCISGFNESVFTDGNVLGISLDKYTGEECEFYPMLGFTLYKQRKMIPEMIPPDVVYTWGMTEFPLGREATTLLDHMVHEGKLLFFCDALLQETADTLLTGFTASQLKWCTKNEVQMWNYLVEHQLLFSTRQMDIVRYINDGPTTNGFPKESPARTGAWLGWQIIKAYMKSHPEITLPQLMASENYTGILNSSGYAPR